MRTLKAASDNLKCHILQFVDYQVFINALLFDNSLNLILFASKQVLELVGIIIRKLISKVFGNIFTP